MDGWNTVDGPPGEEAFTPVYFGDEAKRRLTLPRLVSGPSVMLP